MTDYANLTRDQLIERLEAMERRLQAQDEPSDTAGASEKKYRALFENMVEEVHFWKVMRGTSGAIENWRLVDLNPAAELSWGMKRQDVIGKTANEIFATAIEHFMPIVQKIFDSGKPHTWETFFPDIGQHMKMTSVAFGEYFYTTGFDITHLKLIQRRQEKLGMMARLATEVSNIGVWELDLETGHLTWNEQMLKIYGTDPKSLSHTSQDWSDRIHPDEKEELIATLGRCIEERKNFDSVFRIVTPSGEIRTIKARSEILNSEISDTPIIIGTNIDITDQEKMIEDLKASRELANQSSAAKSAFLATMSHELRTPMNAILGYSQMLQLMAHDRLNEKDKEYIDHIMQSGQHLLALINDVLDLATIETGNQEIEKETLDVSDILSQTEHIIRPIAANKNITIECLPLAANMPQIRSSRIHLNQILLNMLSNAVKYSPQGSRVTMAARVVAPNRIRFSVTDQGCGIAPKDQAIIFSPFTRLHGNTMTSAEGVGIGLAVSKKLAENLGGFIGVDSEVGAGSTFWVEF